MWLKLSVVRETDEVLPPSFANYDYPLKKLQDLLLTYGPSHFNKSGRNPLLYFQVLLMSQQFELVPVPPN
jgi:nuclear pore complex protein Nup93